MNRHLTDMHHVATIHEFNVYTSNAEFLRQDGAALVKMDPQSVIDAPSYSAVFHTEFFNQLPAKAVEAIVSHEMAHMYFEHATKTPSLEHEFEADEYAAVQNGKESIILALEIARDFIQRPKGIIRRIVYEICIWSRIRRLKAMSL